MKKRTTLYEWTFSETFQAGFRNVVAKILADSHLFFVSLSLYEFWVDEKY